MLELNSLVRDIIETGLPGTYRVTAELSEVRLSPRGHCFIELVQKSERDFSPVAKVRGVIMSNIYPLLKMDFEETTGQAFRAGLQVLLEVRLSFSEIYGYSLVVTDIDPSYTLGDMAKLRKQILDRLEKEGVAEMQKDFVLPLLLQRIAIISSPTAAGYDDFCHQLDNNTQRYRFFHQLFPAIMQGKEASMTIISALEKIALQQDDWDVVVIIRGGGAVSDLSCFDTYDLANNCAQFPLPVLTGIGHQRDLTVIDLVSYASLKTPTAVGDFLISHTDTTASELQRIQETLRTKAQNGIDVQHHLLQNYSLKLTWLLKNFRKEKEERIDWLFQQMCRSILQIIKTSQSDMLNEEKYLKMLSYKCLSEQKHRLQLLEERTKALDPQQILNLGYSITLKDNSILRDAADVKAGDSIITRLKKGEITSIVK